jgi:hypothetical protein
MVVSFAKSSKRSRFNRLLKNSVHPSTGLRANGISLEITSKYPFMLSQVEACKLFFNSLFTLDTSPSISKFSGFFIAFAFADLVFAER